MLYTRLDTAQNRLRRSGLYLGGMVSKFTFAFVAHIGALNFVGCENPPHQKGGDFARPTDHGDVTAATLRAVHVGVDGVAALRASPRLIGNFVPTF